MTRPLPRLMMVQTQAENAGAQEISRLVGAGLAARGYEVHHLFFFRRTAGADDLPNLTFCARERPDGIGGWLRLFGRLHAAMRRVRPDVVLTFQHYGNIVGAPFAIAGAGARVIANQVSAEGVTNRLIRGVDQLFGLLPLYRAITVNSDDTERSFAGHPAGYRRKIVHVPHGFALKTSDRPRADCRAALGLPDDGVLIGTAARLHHAKRLDAAVRLLPREPGWRLALAGQGPEEGALRRLAADLGVADRVLFLGELPSAGIGLFLRALDLFVFPSAAETFGLAAVEAAASGTPVVANRLPVLHEVLQSRGRPAALFADADDADAFHAAAATVIGDPVQAAALADAGRELVDRYSLAAMVDAYEALILDVHGRR